MDEFPASVEEAGAYLGMAITRLTVTSSSSNAAAAAQHKSPPAGMHSSFTVRSAVPSTELLVRMYQLRTLLRHHHELQNKAQDKTPLIAAPSLLAVLTKIMTLSATMAPSYLNYNEALPSNTAGGGRPEIPPLYSEAIRHLWVDAVALCHATGSASQMKSTQFLRQMLSTAILNPRSAKAAGGVRIAAWQCVAALLTHMPASLAPWALDVLTHVNRALRSAGHGEPSYRVAAMEAACATATASRQAQLTKLRQQNPENEVVYTLFLAGAYEEKAVQELTRVLKLSSADKFPEVRRMAAVLCGLSCPMVNVNTTAVDWITTLCIRNLDDTSAWVSQQWAAALARGLCLVLASQAGTGSQSSNEATVGSASTAPGKTNTQSSQGWWVGLRSVSAVLRYLSQNFVKVGGAGGAARLGGAHSVGGRAVRVGYTLAIVEFLRLVPVFLVNNENSASAVTYNPKECQSLLLHALLGSDLDKQVQRPDVTKKAGPLQFVSAAQRNWTKEDAPLARTLAARVFRQGLAEGSPETVQIGLLEDWVTALEAHNNAPEETGVSGSASSSPSNKEGRGVGVTTTSTSNIPTRLNANQLQVALGEISHFVTSLAEALSSKRDEILAVSRRLLEHDDAGVRHEASLACTALVQQFPVLGRPLLDELVLETQLHQSELMRLATSGDTQPDSSPGRQGGGLRMFRKKEKQVDSSAPHKQAIHGKSVLLSLLLRDLPHTQDGLAQNLLTSVVPVIEVLCACQFNETLTQAFPSAVCVCVRAGFCLISGLLTTGPAGVAAHTKLVFEAWKRCQAAISKGSKHLGGRHDLFCVDALLVSVVVFLKHSSELLLTVPESLTHVSEVLEGILPLLTPSGRLAKIPLTPPVAAKLESTRASLFEAFAWLPSGSFPMVADDVFAFSAEQIKVAVDSDVSCSILQELVNEEDSLLDVKTVARASKESHSGGARDLAMTLIALESETVHSAEQEDVMHLIGRPRFYRLGEGSSFQQSHILGVFAKRTLQEKPPTPLHEVGAWRRPMDPCCSSKVRLIDAAIQAFSATFGLKSGKEQQSAMDMLESMVPPYYAQLARSVGVNSALTEPDKRVKSKEDSAAMTNITAVLLSCLQSLPLHESTHNVPISMGPPWMSKAKDLLFVLLPSGSNDIRRAAAEGLALLATLGVSEDAHMLQSKVLHSLDEVMQGNRPDAKVLKALPVESVAAARAGSLLTLACIQRTSSDIVDRQIKRARLRAGPDSPVEDIQKKSNSELPVFQMITRILPSINFFGFRDYLVVKSYAIHAFAVLLAYSERLETDELGPVERQLLEKAIELVEDNFCSSWMAASSDVDRGEEPEKMAAETSLLSVLLRLMVFLAKHLHKVDARGGGHARRFALIGHIVLEKHRLHPYVVREVMALFEVLAPSLAVAATQNTYYLQGDMLRRTFACAFPETAGVSFYGSAPWEESSLLSFGSARACVFAELSLSMFRSSDAPLNCDPVLFAGRSLALIERASAAQYFHGARVFRYLAASARSERRFFESSMIREETPKFLLSLVAADAAFDDLCIQWILFARAVLSGLRSRLTVDDTEEFQYSIEEVIKKASEKSESDVLVVSKAGSPSRTDVRAVAAQMLALALDQMFKTQVDLSASPQFNFFEAKKACQSQLNECKKSDSELPKSRLVFHLQELVTTICMSANVALDHSELYSVQESSVHILAKLIECFSQMDDPEVPDTKLLEQYAQQIFSSIKHALSSAEENPVESAVRVYYAGCNAICSIVDHELTGDPAVIKRLVRPILSTLSEGKFVHLSTGEETLESDHVNLTNSKFICEVWTAGQLFFQVNHRADHMQTVKEELLTSSPGLASHFAWISLQGARLLAVTDCDLVGRQSEGRSASFVDSSGGVFLPSNRDMSQLAESLVAKAWSPCCRSAICCLTEIPDDLKKEGDDQEINRWLEAMATLAIEGAKDGLESVDTPISAAYGLNADEVLVECLGGLLLLFERKPDILSRMQIGIEVLLDSLCTHTTIPTLENDNAVRATHVVEMTCKLVLALANTNTRIAHMATVRFLLTPLQYLEEKKLNHENEASMMLLRTSLRGIASIISGREVQASFVHSILRLAVNDIFKTEKLFSNETTKAAKHLFVECVSHNTTSTKDRKRLALDLVQANEWDAWSIVFATDGGVSTHESLVKTCLVLTNHASPFQKAALEAILAVAQNAPPPNETISCLMHTAGSSVAELFLYHGTGKAPRTHGSKEICAGAMKIMLISFMQLVSSGADENDFASFLGAIFSIFLAVIRYNGFPNHPSPQAGGDPALGRLCAQAILHVAKTAPAAFKTCVATLTTHDRTLLEFAVRGEMTGYQIQGATQQKKKLNLASFKK